MSRQCGQCQRPDCPVDADLLPELSGETWVASALTEEFTTDLPSGSNFDLIFCGEPKRQHVSSSAGVDSVKFHPDMDRLCRTVSGIALLGLVNVN